MDDCLVALDDRKGKDPLCCTQCWSCAPSSSMAWRTLHFPHISWRMLLSKVCSFLSPTRMQKCTSSESLLAWSRQPVPAVLWLRDSSVRSIQVFLSLLMSQLFLEENYCVYDLGAWWYSTVKCSVLSSCAFETTLALLAGMSSILCFSHQIWLERYI